MNYIAHDFDRPRVRSKGRVHFLDHLDTHYLCDRLTVHTPSNVEIGRLMERAARDIPGLASADTVCRVAYANPDCFWAIRRRLNDLPRQVEPRGFVAFLMLNEAGVDALLNRRLDATDPPRAYLAGQNEKPAGIYVWLLYAKGVLAPALALVMEKLHTPLYGDVDFFARAVTREGKQFLEVLGFDDTANWGGGSFEGFHQYRRTRTDLAPLSNRPAADDLGVTVVHSFDDLQKAMAIRAAVYVGEQSCPYDEEYDGNDFSGTHLLGYAGSEPAGCVRIRYFAEFVKLERVAVRAEFRHRGLGHRLVHAAVELARQKGYTTLYAHAQRRFIGFWRDLKFEPLRPDHAFTFSDHEYLEVVMRAPPAPQSLSLGVDPFVLIRPEGKWKQPGILDFSARRRPAS